MLKVDRDTSQVDFFNDNYATKGTYHAKLEGSDISKQPKNKSQLKNAPEF
jgi:hypothetical protein